MDSKLCLLVGLFVVFTIGVSNSSPAANARSCKPDGRVCQGDANCCSGYCKTVIESNVAPLRVCLPRARREEDAEAANVDDAKPNVANVFRVSDALSCLEKAYGYFCSVNQTFLPAF